MSFIPILLFFAALILALFVLVPAGIQARLIRTAGPAILFLVGALLMFFGRIGLGAAAVLTGVGLLRRMRGVGTFGPKSTGRSHKSSVRSAALEMELDHDTGEMNGIVLAGSHQGSELNLMMREHVMELRREIIDDDESRALLDAYLDRRFAGWREDAEGDAGSGERGPARTGPMGEKEAYEVLGLAPGAGVAEIRKAHRRLMKGMHPDSGGSTFLAAKINEAKDVLLRSHS